MSSSVLSQRLRELREAGIVTLADEGYVLSDEGRELLALLGPLHGWAQRWAGRGARSKQGKSLGLEQQGHGPVVDERDLHVARRTRRGGPR